MIKQQRRGEGWEYTPVGSWVAAFILFGGVIAVVAFFVWALMQPDPEEEPGQRQAPFCEDAGGCPEPDYP